MKSKLNKSDYIVIIIFYSISSILNIIDYKSRGNDLIEYFVDIPTTIITSYIVILIFMNYLAFYTKLVLKSSCITHQHATTNKKIFTFYSHV